MRTMTVVDSLGQSCMADAMLSCICGNRPCTNYGIRLQGMPTALITTGYVNTGLYIIVSNYYGNSFPSQVKPKLSFTCMTPTNLLPTTLDFFINLTACPLGFSQSSEQCMCVNNINNSTSDNSFVCSNDSFKRACVKKDYWYGNVSGTITVSQCLHLYCDTSSKREPCLPTTYTMSDYMLLSNSQDEQCLYGHGGTLCTGCAEV